jgi:8-oxo-dGTP pyrophosphatase MutT (NUDIX family)
MESLPFEIVTKDGFHAIKNKNSSVAVLLYTLDENELLDKIGVIIEKNPHFPEGSYTGMVMGTVESDDPSLLSRAKQEVLEEAGFEVSDKTRWDFLGEIYTSKIFPESIYCYCVDITGLSGSTPKGDGSSAEQGIQFVLLPLNKATKIPDSILQSSFFKLFSKLYKNQLAN